MGSYKSVYIIETGCGKVKVGVSRNPDKRIKNICSQAGYISTRSYTFDPCSNYTDIEAKAKNHFKRYKINGEWFSISFNDMYFKINGMAHLNESASDMDINSDSYANFIKLYNDKEVKSIDTDCICSKLGVPDRLLKAIIYNNIKKLESFGELKYFESKTGGRPRRVYSLSRKQLNWVIINIKSNCYGIIAFKDEILNASVSKNYLYKNDIQKYIDQRQRKRSLNS